MNPNQKTLSEMVKNISRHLTEKAKNGEAVLNLKEDILKAGEVTIGTVRMIETTTFQYIKRDGESGMIRRKDGEELGLSDETLKLVRNEFDAYLPAHQDSGDLNTILAEAEAAQVKALAKGKRIVFTRADPKKARLEPFPGAKK